MTRTDECYIAPRVNVIEEDGRVLIEADVPGVSREDAKLEVRDGQLILKANRPTNGEAGSYRLRERPTAGYYRAFALHESIDPDTIEAQLKDGVLKVTLAKSESAKPRTISVN